MTRLTDLIDTIGQNVPVNMYQASKISINTGPITHSE